MQDNIPSRSLRLLKKISNLVGVKIEDFSDTSSDQATQTSKWAHIFEQVSDLKQRDDLIMIVSSMIDKIKSGEPSLS